MLAQTPTQERITSFNQSVESPSPFNGLKFRNIGPTIMSGRVTDVEVNPNDPNEFYIAYASGGVWHTQNNGLSMDPIFDHEASMTIGDMAMDWKTGKLWVGTGEVNSSRSSYAGTGVYYTIDTGKTWIHAGLEESHHIGKIVLHPNNTNIAWVAVLGHLYTPNQERGIYKTTDGGKTWKQTLFVNDTTGFVEFVLDPTNPQIAYACAWTRTRKAWNFNGSGEGSAIYKSTDGGESWNKITDGNNGFPQGAGVGRIGLGISASAPNKLYAILDNQFNQEKKKDDHDELKAKEIERMNPQSFLQISEKKLEDFLRNNGYPEKYSASSVKEDIRQKKYTVQDVANWILGDADHNLFDTEVIGAELYQSTDAGKTWKKTHTEILEGVVFTYGYYFGTIAVSPTNSDKLFIAGYPIVMSQDGGTTFKQIDGDNCHPDYHRIWINPNNDKHLIAGNDGGVNITYDDGAHWFKANNPAVGQFYAIAVDDAKPYNVYGGLQDNGTWTAPSNTVENTAWHQSGQNAYKNIGDGDGMQVQVDTRDNQTVYVGYQFGNYFKINKNSGDASPIKAVNDIGQKSFRYNWQTPICLSKHHQDIFYIGSNYLHRSLHQGESLETLGQELTQTKNKGNVPFGTLTSISESSLKFGLIYTGSDDGLIHVSKDGGNTWTKISGALPSNLWVSRVIASQHKESRVYATLNGFRTDDFNAYVYVSDDYGKNWKQLGKQLPLEPVNVIREDSKNENILYLGTDNSLYVSVDRNNFMLCKGDLPRVAIHDIAIQQRENEIVLGTHGRSMYVGKLDLIQKYPTIKDQPLVLFPLDTLVYMPDLGKKQAVYQEPNGYDVLIQFYTLDKDSTEFICKIMNSKKQLVHAFKHTAMFGINSVKYNLQIDESAAKKLFKDIKSADDGKFYLPAGNYWIELSDGQGHTKVEPWVYKKNLD